jgi:rSAM/selenodomain-associated transferase 2
MVASPATLRISLIIPTWREAERIANCVRLARDVADEVIVVDASSPDGTARLAEAAGARVLVVDRKGRGPQLHAGAVVATGDVLLFLHADAELQPGARDAIVCALREPTTVGGNFFLRFWPEGRFARLLTRANHLRRRWFGIYYGDSAIFVRRAVYEALGGFHALPILEDYEFVRRLERHGRTAYVRDVEVRASARRFETRPLRTLFIWVLIQALFMIGVHPDCLARVYADLR